MSSKGRELCLIAGIQICIVLCALDQTVLNTVIPDISKTLHGFERSSWIITSYLLFATVATPVVGKLSDMFGVKRMFLAVSLLFAFTSALCGSAGFISSGTGIIDAMNQLILFRALQGTAGGALIGLCFIAIGKVFQLKERGKLQGLLAASFIAAALAGPVIGGSLIAFTGWRAIFFLNVPLCLLAFICFCVGLQDQHQETPDRSIDWRGIVCLVGSVVPAMLAASQLGQSGRLDLTSTITVVFSLIMFAFFIYNEKNVGQPLIPLQIFRSPIVAVALITVFISGVALFGSMLMLSMMLEKQFQLTPLQCGLWLSPVMVIVGVTSVISGIIAGKTGRYKLLVLLGLSAMAAGSFLLGMADSHTTLITYIAYASLGGIGLGLILPLHTLVMQKAVPEELLGVGTSMSQFFRSLGGSVGTGCMSALLVCALKHLALPDAARQLFVIYGITVALVLLTNLTAKEIDLKARTTA